MYLYGAGHACEFYRDYLTRKGIKIQGIIDGNPDKNGTLFNGIRIYSINEIKKKDENHIKIVISAPSKRKVIANVLRHELPEAEVYSFEIEAYECFNLDVEGYKRFIKNNWERIYKVYSELEDDRSRQVLINMIKTRVTANLDYIDEINESNQYWPDGIIQFSKDECIIECGSNNGDTLLQMCEKLNNQYSHIYCLEPDSTCKDQLGGVIKELDPEGQRITFIPKGSSDKTGVLYFDQKYSNSELSRISNEGDVAINVTALDDIGTGKVTYIKMDVEGAELDTLHGAEKLIKAYKPKLAVCLYHKPEDIVTIPEYLKQLNPNYRFYIRHHNCVITESVLYAI